MFLSSLTVLWGFILTDCRSELCNNNVKYVFTNIFQGDLFSQTCLSCTFLWPFHKRSFLWRIDKTFLPFQVKIVSRAVVARPSVTPNCAHVSSPSENVTLTFVKCVALTSLIQTRSHVKMLMFREMLKRYVM